MALVRCIECNAEVSSRAPACPKCGCPIADIPRRRPHSPRVQTIQKTGKKYKLGMLLSMLLAMGGCVGAVAANAASEKAGANPAVPIFILASLAGLLWFIIVRILTWWDHG